MFDHVVFGASDYAASKGFYLKALEPLGVTIASEGPLGIELCRPNEVSSLCIRREPEAKPAHLHLAFTAANRGQVDAFYRAALAAGGKDNGVPGLRPHYHSNYYAAFVIGPDGHNIEAVCHAPEAQPVAQRGRPACGRCALGGGPPVSSNPLGVTMRTTFSQRFTYLFGPSMKRQRLLLAFALLMLASSAWAADQGYFGFSVAVDGEGFFLNPTLKSIKIEKVASNSPASKAGMVPGDLLIEIEGHQVAGTKADVLKPFMQREVGQSTRLLVKKSTGEVVSLVLVAVPKLEN